MNRAYNLNTNKEKFRSQSARRDERCFVKKDIYRYLIDFCIDSVEFGFFCGVSGSFERFKKLGAFNDYFNKLAPNEGASSLPDVWDGYYRITLAQFHTEDDPEILKKKFESFPRSSVNTQVPGALFRSSRLDLNKNPTYKLGRGFRSHPIALYVDASPDLTIEFLIKEIKKRIHYTEWYETPQNDLHMNIRLYMDSCETADESKWTWDRVCKLRIPEKVARCPIVFSHSRLEIILRREDCTKLYKDERFEQWCSGVTELNGKCSGCKTSVGRGGWEGVCWTCRKYEGIKPIWSIPFSSTVNIV
jgi:hypothetical protein